MDKLEQSNSNLEQFAYAASHDLQEPLRVIASSLDIIEKQQEDRLDDKSKKFLKFAVDSANQMRQLINSLLEVSRNRTDKVLFTFVDMRNSDNPIIDVASKENDDMVEYCISDNGIGIEEKDFSRVFELFKRLHSRTEYIGSGIGLTICKNIVELHGGKIWVESDVDKGSKFYFTLNKDKKIFKTGLYLIIMND